MDKHLNKRIVASLLVASLLLPSLPMAEFGSLAASAAETVATAVAGETKVSEGLEFTSNGDGTCTVTGIGTCTDTDIVIPSVSPDGDKVTAIGVNAFWERDDIGSIVIPHGVTSIGESAFSDCYALTEVALPDSVTEIGEFAFCRCVELKSITIPDGVTSIGDETFFECSSLTSITIPDGMTSIGYAAFMLCSSLTSITIPESVEEIGFYAFSDCTKLESITILNPECTLGTAKDPEIFPFSTTIYGHVGSTAVEYAVDSCNPFVFIGQGDGLEYTFYADGTCGVSGIGTCTDTELEIPSVNPNGDSVEIIESYAFSDCTNLESVIIPHSVTSIENAAFYDCSNLKSVTLPDSATSIGEAVFYNCTNLESITIPDSVTAIGMYSFYGCSSLESITIPDGVTSIGEALFYNCTNLESITIPDSVTSIDGYAFRGCTSLKSIVIPDGVTAISEVLFYNCTNLESVSIPDSVTSIENFAFGGCTNLQSITLPDGVTSIGQRVFADCASLKSITIPDGVTSIGEALFYGCTNLESVSIPDSVTAIESFAFEGCTHLQSITLPEGVTSIGHRVFADCTSLTSFTLPADVTTIGEAILSSCYNLENLSVSENNGKYYTEDNCIIESESKTLVIGCKNSVIPDDGSVTSIGIHAFDWCSSLESITIPDSVLSIGRYAFSGCTGLTTITIPNSVTELDENVFYGCANLESITISNPECTIGYSEIPSTTIICGYAGSTAQAYAETYGNPFMVLNVITNDEVTVSGTDVTVNATDSDATLISSAITSELAGKVTTVTTPVGTVSFDVTASDKIAATDEDVQLIVTDVTTEIESVKAIRSYSITLTAGGRPILPYDEAGTNGNITVSVPYLTGLKLEDITVTHIGEDGSTEDVPVIGYDPETGIVTFTTTHLSRYEITSTSSVLGDTDSTGDDTADNDTSGMTQIIISEVTAGNNITLWEDGACKNLIDGDSDQTKMGGNVKGGAFSMTFSTEKASTIHYYTLYTGGDSGTWTGRNPVGWVLCGSNDGENWTVIDVVDVSGLEDVDAQPFTYKVDSPAEYSQYKIVFEANPTTNLFQMNELVLFNDPAYGSPEDDVDVLYGDANGDGTVNAKDLTRLSQYLANYDYSTGLSTVVVFPGADANGDGTVNAKDLTRLSRYLAYYDYSTGTSSIVLGPNE